MEPDAELLARWGGCGDKAAGNKLFQRHFAAVHRFFVNKVRDAATAEDLVQETFTRLAECYGNFGGRSSFRTFVFGIGRYVLMEHFREHRHDHAQPIEDMSVVDLGAGPSSVAAARQELRVLLDALRRVPLQKQIVLELYYFEEFTGAELAQMLRISEAAARGRLRLSLDALRDTILQIAPTGEHVQTLLEQLEAWRNSLLDQVELANASS